MTKQTCPGWLTSPEGESKIFYTQAEIDEKVATGWWSATYPRATDGEGEAKPRRGRPRGSKNRVKEVPETAQVAAEDDVEPVPVGGVPDEAPGPDEVV